MIRLLLKTAVAAFVHATRAERLASGATRHGRVPFILTYHRVVEDPRLGPDLTHPAMLLRVKTFERHVEWLARSFDLISLDEVAERMGEARGRRPAAAITFDDGYQDVCDNALPLLHRKGIPAAVFVVTDRVGTSEIHLHDRLYLLVAGLYGDWPTGARRLAAALNVLSVDPECIDRALAPGRHAGLAAGSLLSELDQATLLKLIDLLAPGERTASAAHALAGWESLRAAARDGFTIGSHGCTHALLGNEDARTVIHEVLGSRLEIERRLGLPVRHIAYPSGSFDAVAVRIVAAAGYRCGYTICRHRDPHFPELTIPRHVFWENTCRSVGGAFSGALMSCHVHDVLGFRASCRGHERPARARQLAPAASAAYDRASLVRSEPGS